MKYKISELAILEMVCSIIIAISMFLPWIRVETNLLGIHHVETKSIVEINSDYTFLYIMLSICALNFVGKFFKRLLWLSVLTCLFPLSIIYTIQEKINENGSFLDIYATKTSFGIGALIVICMSFLMIFSVIIGWILYLRNTALGSPRQKYKRHLILAGCGFMLGIINEMFYPLILKSDGLYEPNSFILIIILSFIALFILFLFIDNIIIALMILFYTRGNKKNNPHITTPKPIGDAERAEETDDVEKTDITEEQVSIQYDSPHNDNEYSTYNYNSNNDKWYYMTAAIIGLIALLSLGWLHFSGPGKEKNNPLGLESPKWEKFVYITTQNIRLYNAPYDQSATLKYGTDYEYKMRTAWTEEDLPEGYTMEGEYDAYRNIYPVIEETDKWYKVYINAEGIKYAWIKKSECKEIYPEPITPELFTRPQFSDIWKSFHLINKGKYKDVYFCYKEYAYEDFNEIATGTSMEMGVLDNGAMLTSTMYISVPIIYNDKNNTLKVTLKDDSDIESGEKKYYVSITSNLLSSSPGDDNEHFDPKKLSEDDVETLVTSLTMGSNDGIVCYYYFPNVHDIPISFTFYPDESTSENEKDENNLSENVIVSDYMIKDNCVMAKIGSEWTNTEITSDENIIIWKKEDLDGDGNMEAIVWDKNDYYPSHPFVVYYDTSISSFNKTAPMELTDTLQLQKDNEGSTQLIQYQGICWTIYEFKDGELKKIGNQAKNMGKIRFVLDLNETFGEDEEGNKELSFDFDGDGEDETIILTRDFSHAGGYGTYMNLTYVKWQDGHTIENIVYGETLKILESNHKGMPDIIADNYLKIWDGENYKSWGWDGKKLIQR